MGPLRRAQFLIAPACPPRHSHPLAPRRPIFAQLTPLTHIPNHPHLARPCLSSSKPSSPSASRPIPHRARLSSSPLTSPRATPPHLRATCSFNTLPQPSPSRPPPPLVLATHIPSRHASQCSRHLLVQHPSPTIPISPACPPHHSHPLAPRRPIFARLARLTHIPNHPHLARPCLSSSKALFALCVAPNSSSRPLVLLPLTSP